MLMGNKNARETNATPFVDAYTVRPAKVMEQLENKCSYDLLRKWVPGYIKLSKEKEISQPFVRTKPIDPNSY